MTAMLRQTQPERKGAEQPFCNWNQTIGELPIVRRLAGKGDIA